ncbi:MAG: UvrD-helicase domain-containing protein [Candidatus Krumholzibacteriota bacterium]|nr:UvrD-helicase domain-containing protein [Candidatus Krumholzibacteriota bacterium]
MSAAGPWQELERELNPRQREAVFTSAPHCLVLAGPGTGKTRTLVNRVVYLVSAAGVDPGAILPLTFTRKAATVMVERLARHLGERAAAVRAGTFHHFCLQLLRANAGRGDVPGDFAVADEPRQVRTLQRAWNRLGVGAREPEPKELRLLLGRFGAWRLERDPKLLTALQRDLFTEYQRLLREEGAIDFDDILDLARGLLADDADLLAATRARWTRILVDEFQDTDALQYRLLRLLAPAGGSSFVVADDDQSIYAWRGADRRNIARYRDDYAPAEIWLEENYRNRERILAAARAVLGGESGGAAQRLRSHAGGAGSVSLERFRTEAEEADFLAADIRRARLRAPTLAWRDVAVLYPKHSIGEYLETRLMGERIPVELVAGRALLEQGRIRQVVAFLRLLRNGNDEEALEQLLAAQLDEGSWALLRACGRRRGDSVRQALAHLLRRRDALRARAKHWEQFLADAAGAPDADWTARFTAEFPRGLALDEFLPDALDPDAGRQEELFAPGQAPGPPDRAAWEREGARLAHLARLPWLLEGVVARIGNLRAGQAGRTLSQLVREILLELEDGEEELPGDPAAVAGLAAILAELRERLRRGGPVQISAEDARVEAAVVAMLRQGLEPWLAQGLIAGGREPRPGPRLILDAERKELRLELPARAPFGDGAPAAGEAGADAARPAGERLAARGAAPALLAFRLAQLWRAADHRGLADYVVFDLETTGVDTARCEVVEVAAIRYEGGREVARFESLVRPAGPIPPGATDVHGITDAMVEGAPPPAQALGELRAFAGGRDLVAHNGAGFDYPVLQRLARESGQPRFANALFDTLALARRLFPGDRVRLEDLIRRFGIRAEARHRALDDCRCLGEAFARMQEIHLGRLRRRAGAEALAPLALALHLDPGGAPTGGDDPEAFALFREGVRRLLAPGSDWLDRVAGGEERQTLEADLLAAAGLDAEAPDLFTGLRSEEQRFLALVPRFDELFLGDSLASFLDFLALYQAPDLARGQNAVQLMTIHSAKGLEFERVYIVGLEENVLPGYYALRGKDAEEIAEERRLLYVAMTRAAGALTLTRVDTRGGFRQEPSRFLDSLARSAS